MSAVMAAAAAVGAGIGVYLEGASVVTVVISVLLSGLFAFGLLMLVVRNARRGETERTEGWMRDGAILMVVIGVLFIIFMLINFAISR